MSYMKEFTKGLIKENPTLVTLLGMCPTLAITTMASNAIGMGAAATFVLICSNVVISLLKKVIPKAVRLPCYIVIIAGFVTLVGLLLQAFVPAVYDALGLYLPLITVNCIILGRAEMFASKNNVAASALDGAGMGIGFTLALLVMGSIREIIGSGSWFGIDLGIGKVVEPMTLFVMPAGGFFVLGCVIAIVNKIANREPPKATGCAGCPNKDSCAGSDAPAVKTESAVMADTAKAAQKTDAAAKVTEKKAEAAANITEKKTEAAVKPDEKKADEKKSDEKKPEEKKSDDKPAENAKEGKK